MDYLHLFLTADLVRDTAMTFSANKTCSDDLVVAEMVQAVVHNPEVADQLARVLIAVNQYTKNLH